ncbi:patatin [Fervidicella metallireducens AeB]|uniref:Patatin n=1 Tax=Fervidicella metallireducens AeB TaxID=1403537 RepID=A0A017RX55_9CLOT|nr:patatin-like phospholipase family protein [Fervidicella metallireducens]EYE89156.1 patatin [Fervidicella metallireducens AeB]
MNGYGLVLGGGGAKGGYEIGVWKALKELDIPIKAVAGTSVGALNGAMIVQDDYELASELWTSLSIESVIKVEKELAVVNEKNKKSPVVLAAMKNMISSGGLDVTPLKELLNRIINEKKIRDSQIDLGMVTFSLSDFKPIKVFKSDIPDGKLVDYLLASSCFPAFKPHEIDSKKFIDGGVYDNIPVSLMIEKGIKDIIVVDISGLGLVRKIDKKGLNIIEIKNSEDLGGTLDFNGERSKINIDIGYYDTLKAFGKLKGSRYYIIPSDEFEDKKRHYIDNIGLEEIKKMYNFLGVSLGPKSAANSKLILDRILRTINQYAGQKLDSYSIFPAMAEITAEQLGIDRRRIYDLNELVQEIMKEYDVIKNSADFKEYIKGLTKLILSRSQLEFDREIKKTLIEGKFLISYDPYLYETNDNIKRFRRFLAVAMPKILIANMFISLILSKEDRQGQ